MIGELWSKLDGKKTYIAMLALAVIAFLEGAFEIPVADEWKWLVAAIGGITLRAGVSKADRRGTPLPVRYFDAEAHSDNGKA